MHGIMGEHVRTYKPVWNVNRLLHLLTIQRRAFSTSAVVTMQKRIPDVSYWQGIIDWDKMRAQTDAVIIRVGRGKTQDTQFKRNWAEAKKRGMKRGLYVFYEDTTSPANHAQMVYDSIRLDPPELEIVYDWETTYKGKYAGLGNVVASMEALEGKMGKQCTAFYTGYYWFVSNSNAIKNASHYKYLKQRPLWLAWYVSNPAVVKVPAPWSSLWMWQFGTPVEGYAYGCQSKEIDMSWYNGTDFYTRYGGTPGTPLASIKLGVYSDGSVKNVSG